MIKIIIFMSCYHNKKGKQTKEKRKESGCHMSFLLDGILYNHNNGKACNNFTVMKGDTLGQSHFTEAARGRWWKETGVVMISWLELNDCTMPDA